MQEKPPRWGKEECWADTLRELCLPACPPLPASPPPQAEGSTRPLILTSTSLHHVPCPGLLTPSSGPSSWGWGREGVQTLTLSAGVQPGFALCSEDEEGGEAPGSLWEEGPCPTAQHREKAELPLT